ncbi:Transforming acidic coiled-coil-containing protei n 3 [Trichuris trichiura]|uniref:Transforming acidic coiled-coil-containing protei n 3 n=1 Tax=Trichuris trichiura TaxID=36087 RepID=A0A077ZHT8_TRITR|nr:Transforming acidic coiled-coil-containing protei n 3 [Trichuris trichiura]
MDTESEVAKVLSKPTDDILVQTSEQKELPSQKVPLTSVQQTAVVAPMIQAMKNRANGDVNSDSDNEEYRPAAEFLNSTFAFEYLNQASSSNAADLYRDSLYVQFDPLVEPKPLANPAGNMVIGHRMEKFLREQKAAVPPELRPLTADEHTPSKTSIGCFSQTPNTIVKKPARRVNNADCDAEANTPIITVDNCEDNTNNISSMQLEMKAMSERLMELTAQNSALRGKCEELSNRASADGQKLQEMDLILKEYEATISEMKSLSSNHKKKVEESIESVIKERDNAIDDLQAAENVIAELLKRFDKLRSTVSDLKKNEVTLKASAEDLSERLAKSEARFRQLRDNAEDKVTKLKIEMDRMAKSRDADMVGIRAQVKKYEVLTSSLEKECEQKAKQIQELSSICDELIQKADRNDA